MNAPATLPGGDWGGEQVVLSIGEDKARLRLGCADAEFDAPVSLDTDRRFSADGLYTAHGGGPSTASERPVKARFEGVLAGDWLTLTVRYADQAETYRLAHGVQAKVIRCL